MDVERVSAIVVDSAYRIHRRLGPGLVELVYESILAQALEKAGLRVERQKAIRFEFEGLTFEDGMRIDLLIESCLIVELKSVEAMVPVHAKQLLTYLRLANLPIGLLINFGTPTFKEGVKRIVNNPNSNSSSLLRLNQRQ